MGKFDGKVALITGGARGQGRSHAVNLAREGADIIVVDICRQIASVEHSMSTPEDLAETVRLVEEHDRRVVPIEADVRDYDAVRDAVERGARELGRLDIVVANAGIMATTGAPAQRMDAWHASVDTMLSGVYYTLKSAVTPMLDGGRGGSIVITSSTSGLRGVAYSVDMLSPGQMGYGAAKHGVIGLMRNFAMALGKHGIRVNCIHPMGVRTPMVVNEFFAGVQQSAPPGWMANLLEVGLIEPQDVSNAVLWLCSDEARYVTGSSLAVDSGQLILLSSAVNGRAGHRDPGMPAGVIRTSGRA
jgi:SDR family mycofactocin-dependent oxidoreductase